MDDAMFKSNFNVVGSPLGLVTTGRDLRNPPFNNIQAPPSSRVTLHNNHVTNDVIGAMTSLSVNNSSMQISSNELNHGRFNLSANEFIPKVGNSLHQSVSAPAFERFHTGQVTKPMQTVIEGMLPANLNSSGSPRLHPRSKSPNQALPHPVPQNDVIQDNYAGTTYFYNQEDYASSSPPNRLTFPAYSVYTTSPSHIAHMKHNPTSTAFFIKDEIKMDMLNRQMALLSEIEGVSDLPAQVDKYSQLVPLEETSASLSQFGYPTTVYKAISQNNGVTYCLYRVHGYKLVSTKCMAIIEQWKKITNVHLVTLREVFTTKAFGDNSIVFVYDYHPASETLTSKHFCQTQLPNGYANPFNIDGSARPFSAGKGSRKPSGTISEATIWSYIIQLSSALRVIHSNKLAVRCLDASKVIVTDKTRLRINCVGMHDVLNSEAAAAATPQALLTQQREDLMNFGKIVLALAANAMIAVHKDHIKASIEMVKRYYSPDLHNIIVCLFQQNTAPNSINSIMPMIGARFYTHLESLQTKVDSVEHELMKEVESSRLFRIITKINSILERSEFNMDSQWAETGDRYLLKLFRDYVFHQVTSNGTPWIDMSHIISSLNKLDAGTNEKICLTSRDQTSVIITSYSELKRCFESAFSELMHAKHTSDT